MIRVKNLHKRFKTFHALKGIDINVRKGEIYGFIGRNGAGKSTTINILAGLSRPGGGECIVNGKDISDIEYPSDLRIGYLPEDLRFYTWLTAYETLNYLGNGAGRRVSKARIDEMLEWVGLSEASRRRVGGFSRGMRQRLGIAAALIHDPDLLILDEPSSALDPEGRSDVLLLIRQLKQMGKTVFFSTHILSDVERVCDTVGMIVSGTMAMEKPLKQIWKDNIVPIFDVALQTPFRPEMEAGLRAIEGVVRVEVKGDAVSVAAADAEAVSRRLMRFLSEQDVAVREFTLRKNNLEDIFIQGANGE